MVVGRGNSWEVGWKMQKLRVCVYEADDGPRVGSVDEDRVYDLNLCCAARLDGQGVADPFGVAGVMAPPGLDAFLAGGDQALAEARRSLEWAIGQPDGASVAGRPLSRSPEGSKLKAPITASTKVICMGRVFMSHVVIGGLEPHPKPTPFYKLNQVVVGPDEWVVLPKHHYPDPVVYGTELTVVIGKSGRSIPEERVQDHIWGYTVLNDVTMRGVHNTMAKAFDTSAPVGPWIVPRDQLPDPHAVRLSLRLNGKEVQSGNTKDLRFTIEHMVAESSKWLTLQPGDIISTGDVGATVPLSPGDVMEAEVEGVGVLRNPVRLEE